MNSIDISLYKNQKDLCKRIFYMLNIFNIEYTISTQLIEYEKDQLKLHMLIDIQDETLTPIVNRIIDSQVY